LVRAGGVNDEPDTIVEVGSLYRNRSCGRFVGALLQSLSL